MGDEPEKIRVSKKTASKIRKVGSNPPAGEELTQALDKIVKKLKES